MLTPCSSSEVPSDETPSKTVPSVTHSSALMPGESKSTRATWELWQMLRPRTPGLSCGSPPPTEAGKRNPDPCPHVPPFTPDKQGLKVPLRDLGEKALTCAWGTASSRFAEAGGQDTLSASAPCSQYPFLHTRR